MSTTFGTSITHDIGKSFVVAMCVAVGLACSAGGAVVSIAPPDLAVTHPISERKGSHENLMYPKVYVAIQMLFGVSGSVVIWQPAARASLGNVNEGELRGDTPLTVWFSAAKAKILTHYFRYVCYNAFAKGTQTWRLDNA